MNFSKKLFSFEESAAAEVARNLCQDDCFMEVALRLDKPTYGAFFPMYSSSFITNPELLSSWAKLNDGIGKKRSRKKFKRSCILNDFKEVDRWDEAVDKQCLRLTEHIPYKLKFRVQVWINRIALEYLNFSRRLEILCGVSRYFLIDHLTQRAWKKSVGLKESKLAKCLIKDERLTVIQQYRIACIYCLHSHIVHLWELLTQEEKRSIYIDYKSNTFPVTLVLLWSNVMKGLYGGGRFYATRIAVLSGNRAALILFWKWMKKRRRQSRVANMARISLEMWQKAQKSFKECMDQKRRLESNDVDITQTFDCMEYFNLRSCYSNLMCFFLSQMDEDQQMKFFIESFKNRDCDMVLECFLDWPHQDYFMPTIRRLWGIIPKDKFVNCLLTLSYENTDFWHRQEGASFLSLDKEKRYNDYRSLLQTLWEETPEEYKQYLFLDKNRDDVKHWIRSEGETLLLQLVKGFPFQEKDEALFKLIFRHQPQEQRTGMMLSEVGNFICIILTQEEKWSFLNWLLEECLPKKEVPSFKKQFLCSHMGCAICFTKLIQNNERWVEEVINWTFDSDTEKIQFKYGFIANESCGFGATCNLLMEGEFAKVENILNFCVPPGERKEKFKIIFAEYIFSAMSKKIKWKKIDALLAWSFNTKEEKRNFKKNLFSSNGMCIH
ncbi:uncharacterized protein NPIL_443291 [Nephila pilipes]|uniref:Uncharacterized protein n=1 Tax=Nephila pilipes TaxID=299642 RepID=A0A8X6QTX2_NEPPI|nr:uncharacterized protein NPIL_443291 [Nephila pilipes]